MEEIAVSKEELTQMFWEMKYNELLMGVEITYHAWQLRQQEALKCRIPAKAEEKHAVRLSAQGVYNQARERLYNWLLEHPVPMLRQELPEEGETS